MWRLIICWRHWGLWCELWHQPWVGRYWPHETYPLLQRCLPALVLTEAGFKNCSWCTVGFTHECLDQLYFVKTTACSSNSWEFVTWKHRMVSVFLAQIKKMNQNQTNTNTFPLASYCFDCRNGVLLFPGACRCWVRKPPLQHHCHWTPVSLSCLLSWSRQEGHSSCWVHDSSLGMCSCLLCTYTSFHTLCLSVCLHVCVQDPEARRSFPCSPSWPGSRNLTVKRKNIISIQMHSYRGNSMLGCSKSQWDLTSTAKPWQMLCEDSVWESRAIKLIPVVIIQLVLWYGTRKCSYCSSFPILFYSKWRLGGGRNTEILGHL